MGALLPFSAKKICRRCTAGGTAAHVGEPACAVGANGCAAAAFCREWIESDRFAPYILQNCAYA